MLALPLGLKIDSILLLVLLYTRDWVNMRLVLALTQLGVVCLPTAILIWMARQNLRGLGLTRPAPLMLAAGIAVGCGLAALNVGLGGLITLLAPEELLRLLGLDAGPMLLAQSGWELAMLLAVVGGVGPLFEELLFRGLIQRDLATRMSIPAAMALSSAVFAGFHLNPLLFLPLFGLGYLFAYLALRGGLWPAICAHASYNTLSLLALNRLPMESSRPIVFCIIALLGTLVALAAILSLRSLKKSL
ncbi:MAG: CPBP family intramembrane metalloprotease [Candidatus Alcyoniella australis]|nr:CPBP family intramembrane metalloprotease [Candidatus Alcyoniella australis]